MCATSGIWRGSETKRHKGSCNSIKMSSMHMRNLVLPGSHTLERQQALPPVCTEAAHIWRARSPLICFEIVEMHLFDRVLRQFRFAQHIPNPVEQVVWIEGTSKCRCDWSQKMSTYISRWDDRAIEVQSHDFPLQYHQTT